MLLKAVFWSGCPWLKRPSSFQEHQRGRGAEQAEAEARAGSGGLSEEEGDGQDAAGEGQAGQAGEEGEGEEAHTKRGAQKIKVRRWGDFLRENILLPDTIKHSFHFEF